MVVGTNGKNSFDYDSITDSLSVKELRDDGRIEFVEGKENVYRIRSIIKH